MNRLLASLVRALDLVGHVRPELSAGAIAAAPMGQNRESFTGVTPAHGNAGAPWRAWMRRTERTSRGVGQPRVRFRFTRDATGAWILTDPSCEPGIHFSDLAVALSFARREAAGAEADIELWADGLYIFVHQPRGWPHVVCVPRGVKAKDRGRPLRSDATPGFPAGGFGGGT